MSPSFTSNVEAVSGENNFFFFYIIYKYLQYESQDVSKFLSVINTLQEKIVFVNYEKFLGPEIRSDVHVIPNNGSLLFLGEVLPIFLPISTGYFDPVK